MTAIGVGILPDVIVAVAADSPALPPECATNVDFASLLPTACGEASVDIAATSTTDATAIDVASPLGETADARIDGEQGIDGEAPATIDAAVETEVEQEAGDEAKREWDESMTANADRFGLSSCLMCWQVLPLPTPPVVAPQAVSVVSLNPEENFDGSGGGEFVGEKIDRDPEITLGRPIDLPVAEGASQPMPVPVPARKPVEHAGRGDSRATPTFQTPVATAPLPAPAAVAASSAPPITEAAAAAVVAEIAPVPAPGMPRPARALAAAEVLELTADGIPAAKEHRAMPDLHLPTPAKNAPAPFAESRTIGETTPSVSEDSLPAVVAAPTSTARSEYRGGGDSSPDQNGFTPAAPLAARAGEPDFHAPERNTVTSDAAQVLQQVERTVERLRAHESQRIEVRLPLEDGGEVIVKLRIEQGHVRAIFQTGSEGLRSALESGWTQLAHASQSGEVKLADAVFEAAPAQTGGHNFQQSREQRGQQHPAQAEFVDANLAGYRETRRKPAVPATASAPVRPENIQTYA